MVILDTVIVSSKEFSPALSRDALILFELARASVRRGLTLAIDKAAICAGMTTMIDDADRASNTAFAATCGCRPIDRTVELHARFGRVHS